jgi:hypothetical protein
MAHIVFLIQRLIGRALNDGGDDQIVVHSKQLSQATLHKIIMY